MKDLRLAMEIQKKKIDKYTKIGDSSDKNNSIEKFAKQAQFIELYTNKFLSTMEVVLNWNLLLHWTGRLFQTRSGLQ